MEETTWKNLGGLRPICFKIAM